MKGTPKDKYDDFFVGGYLSPEFLTDTRKPQMCNRDRDSKCHSQCSSMDRRRAQYGKDYEEPTGQAVVTKGYNLLAEHVIHTVGPIVYGKLTEDLKEDLRNCYKNILKCCVEHEIRSVAFCCISTGEFHFPNDEAARIAVEEVRKFLEKHEENFDRILFNVFKDVDRALYQELV